MSTDKCDICRDWDVEYSVKRLLGYPKDMKVCSGCLSEAVQRVLSESSANTVLVSEA